VPLDHTELQSKKTQNATTFVTPTRHFSNWSVD
jgi:hypothetical protein